MTYVLDTNAVSALMKGHEAFVDRLAFDRVARSYLDPAGDYPAHSAHVLRLASTLVMTFVEVGDGLTSQGAVERVSALR